MGFSVIEILALFALFSRICGLFTGIESDFLCKNSGNFLPFSFFTLKTGKFPCQFPFPCIRTIFLTLRLSLSLVLGVSTMSDSSPDIVEAIIMEVKTVERWQQTGDVEVFVDEGERKVVFKKFGYVYAVGLEEGVGGRYQDLGEIREKFREFAYAPGERMMLFARNEQTVVTPHPGTPRGLIPPLYLSPHS